MADIEKHLKRIRAFVHSSIETNSRGIADWRDDFIDVRTSLDTLISLARAERAEAAQPAKREPDGYAYRYHSPFADGTVVRFNDGREVNGGRPIEAIPYWLGEPPAEAAQRVPLTDERIEAALRSADVRTQYFQHAITRKVLWTTAGSIDVRQFVRAIEAALGITTTEPSGERDAQE